MLRLLTALAPRETNAGKVGGVGGGRVTVHKALIFPTVILTAGPAPKLLKEFGGHQDSGCVTEKPEEL